MKEAKQLAQEYSKAMDTAKRVEEELVGVLIKYLVANSFEPKKCTETAIADSLGIPKSMIRRVFSKMSSEFLVKTEDWGTVKPYEVWMFGAALDKGYLTLSRGELSELLCIGEKGEDTEGPTIGDPSVWVERKGGRVVRFLGPGQKKVYRTLISRFFWYTPRTGIDEVFDQAFPKKTLAKLEALLPEQSLLDDVSKLPEISDALWHIVDYTIDISFWENKKPDMSKMKELVQQQVWKKIMFVIHRLRLFESMIKEKGTFVEAEKTLSTKKGCPVDRVEGDDGEIEGEEKFRKEYLFATTMAIREGCKFARAIGVDESTLKEAEGLCTTLEQAADNPNQKIKSL